MSDELEPKIGGVENSSEKTSQVQETNIERQENTENTEAQNFQDNIERYQGEVDSYLEKGYSESLPENYKNNYETVLDTQYQNLQEKPIDPNCKFSLVLPAYREEKAIRQTLESLQNQEGVNPEDYEVIVVNNYPEGKKPRLNDYDESGKKVGEHEDKTTDIVKEFAKTSKLKVQVIEQDFPQDLAGVGIAAKLGMDIAVKRQEENPQIVGYCGTDTIFDKNWVKEVLEGYKHENIDGVRGTATSGEVEPIVEDEKGLHKLSPAELKEIKDLEYKRYLYEKELDKLSHKITNKTDTPRQQSGLATMTIGTYAKIGGIKPLKSGEDWKIAQEVYDLNGGRGIYHNLEMKTITASRIEKPRAEGGSYTGNLWNMFRAYKYGEGNILDSEKNIIVEDPQKILETQKVFEKFQKYFAGMTAGQNLLADKEDLEIINQYCDPKEIELIDQVAAKNKGNWEGFMVEIPKQITDRIKQRISNHFSNIPIDEAKEKLNQIK